jgi:hypothetical protein
MTWFFRSIIWLYNICPQVCMSCLPTYELHISHLDLRWERERAPDYAYNKNTTNFERRKKADIMSAFERIHKYHIWETWESHTQESLSFIWKSYKNSLMKVDQRAWDIVLDLTILSFNHSRLR